MTAQPAQSALTREVVYLATLQFSTGGLFDGKPTSSRIHLIRGTHSGTPGPTLCGIERMQRDGNGKLIGPGFSVGGGIIEHGREYVCCEECSEVARRDFPGLPVAGSIEFARVCAEAVGSEGYGHSCDVPARRDWMRDMQAARDAARAAR